MAEKSGRIWPSGRIPALIGRIVRKARMESGLTQEELAAKCGVCRRSIITIERGGNYRVAALIAVIERLPKARRGLARLLLT